eukprot:m.233738 g.233738  ORF g.233738 m.233738 type:complete len:141 (+) comp15741_c0_seq2:14-436(+)
MRKPGRTAVIRAFASTAILAAAASATQRPNFVAASGSNLDTATRAGGKAVTQAATLDLELIGYAPVFPHDFWAAAPMTDRNMNPNMSHWLVSDAEMRASGEYGLLGWHGPGGVAADAVVSLRDGFHGAMWRGLLMQCSVP